MRANLKPLVIWCAAVLFMVAGGMGKFVGFSASDQSINDLMAQMPKFMRSIIGVGDFDLSTASGFYGVIFLYLAVMATVHAAMLGANIMAKEEQDRTSEFLFAKPVSRDRVVSAKLLAGLANISIFNAFTLASSVVIVSYLGRGEDVTGKIIVLMAGMYIMQLIFLLIGTGTAAAGRNPKAAASTATGVLLVAFLFYVLADLNRNLEVLRFFTPFKYYEAKNLMDRSGYDPVYVLLSIAIIVFALIITYVYYRRRDLNV